MYFWICAKCGEKVWCCDTCDCGNTRDKNAELVKERERQKKIEKIRKERR